MTNCKCGCSQFLYKIEDGKYSDVMKIFDFDPVKHVRAVCLDCNALLSSETSGTPLTDTACRMVDGNGWTREYEKVETKFAEDLEKKLHKAEKESDDLRGRVIELECALKWWVNEVMQDFEDASFAKGKMRNLLLNGSLPVQEITNEK